MKRYTVGAGGDTGTGTGTQRAAVEDPNSLRSKSYANIIDAIGEGEFEEVCVGGLKGLYLNDIAAQNSDGTNNVEGITLETRTGSLSQSRMNIANTTEASFAVSTEMLYNLPVEKAVTGTSVDYLRVVVAVPRLTFQDTTTGDLRGTSVNYRIEYNSGDNPTWRVVPTATSKINYNFVPYGTPQTGYSRYEVRFTVYPSRYFTSAEILAPCLYTLQYTLNGGTSWIDAQKQIAFTTSDLYVFIDTLKTDTVDFRLLVQNSPSFVPAGTLIQEAWSQITNLYAGNYVDDAGTQTISGKTTSSYEKQTSFKVTGESPYTVRCIRLTADSTSEALQNKTVFQSVSVVTEEKFTYPGTALVGLSVDATQFNSIPTRAFLCKMLKVKVPTNYNPLTREYTGFWNGSFKTAWTDNPAWCFYDLITNKRYGLGERVPASFVDAAALYAIGQYCDEYVPNGEGGMEPRFTCNLYIQTQHEAYKVISDMASVFRGITYWASGAIVPVQDSEKQLRYTFTNANVIDGMFQYQGSDVNTRYNAVSVTWNDPKNMYRQAVEYVADEQAIAALGYINHTSTVAFGCTSKAQARRAGKWLLYTNTYETDAVTFSTGLEGAIPMPGDLISIVDSLRALERRGGRVVDATLTEITLDTEMTFLPGVVYTFSVASDAGNLMDATFEYDGTTQVITLDAPLSSPVAKDSFFAIADDNIPAALYRVIAISEGEDSLYTISAVTYDPSKYNYVELDERLTPTTGAIVYVGGVTGITTTELLYSDGAAVRSKLVVAWKAPAKAVAYQLYIVAPDGVRREIYQTDTSYEILDTLPGDYKISIVASDILGNVSVTTTVVVAVLGKLAPPVAVTNLAVKSYNGNGVVTWDLHPDLDVRIGGLVVIKYTTKTSNVQWEDGVIVATVPGGNTQANVPLMTGTYTAKAIDEGGRYSTDFASALSSFAELSATNAMATLVEDPVFSGEKDNLFVSGGLLTLSTSKLWDDIALIDEVEEVDYLGFGSLSGTYYFRDVIDLTGVYTVRVYGTVTGYATIEADTINSRNYPLNEWARFNGEIINNSVIKLMISTTNDDPENPSAVWGEYVEFIVADYTARGFRFKVEMAVTQGEHILFVENLSVSVDAVDRVEGQDNITVPSTGFSVSFASPFATTPAIAISIDAMQNGDYYRLTGKSQTGFTATLYNSSNTPVARQIDWIAKGYGREII